MAKRIWDAEPNIDEHYGKFRIKIWHDNRYIVNETIGDSDVTRKSDLARVIKLRDKYLARLTLDEPIRSKATKSKPKTDNNLITFSQAAERYLKIYTRDLDSASIADYKKHLNAHWIPAFGNWLMCDIIKGSIRRVSVDAALLPIPLIRYLTAVETVSSAALERLSLAFIRFSLYHRNSIFSQARIVVCFNWPLFIISTINFLPLIRTQRNYVQTTT